MPDLLWRHVVLNTKCSWLHGDERGFRSRNHCIHASGDYKHRPPIEEHEELRRYHYSRSGPPIAFIEEMRIRILESFVKKTRSLGIRIIAGSCAELHLHALMEVIASYPAMKREVGKCKQRASYDVRDILQGNIWSEGGEYKEIEGRHHLHATYRYTRLKQEPGTIVWSHNDDENWIDHPEVGVIVMSEERKQIRIFASSSDPAS
jgi:hypothetical protein